MTTPPMLRQLRHDVWATERLIAHCRQLSTAQLELTVPGTYGTIRRTLAHIVTADQRYLTRFLTLLEPKPRVRLDDALTHNATQLRLANESDDEQCPGAEWG